MTRGGCFDVDITRAEKFAAASGHQVMSSEQEVIASSDIIYICTWTSEHQRLVEMCIAANKPFFCEKPLSTGFTQAQQMTTAAA